MTIKKFTLLFLLIFITVSNCLPQSLPVTLMPPPPYQFKTEDLWNLTITNNTAQSFSIYLHGTAVERSTGIIVDATTGVFSLPVGVKRVKSGDVGKVTINESNKTYEDVVQRLSSLPTGTFDICVDVIDNATGAVIGNSCISHEVLNVSQVQLVYPLNSSVNQSGNQYIIFSWLPPVPVPLGYKITYRIKLAEIISMQSPYDAMQSNPLFFSRQGIFQSSFQYPVEARSFKNGGRYAWQVQAFINGVLLSESEIWDFTYGDTQPKVTNTKTLKWMERYWSASFSLEQPAGGKQNKRSALQLALNSTLYGESANRFGNGSDKEPRFGYFELTPSLIVYGLPFSTNVLLSSENSSSRQNINSIGINFDVSAINDFISQKKENEKSKILSDTKKEISDMSEKEREKLDAKADKKVMDKLNPVLKFMSYFRSLGFGTNYPSYSSLTMQGVPVTGINLEFNPGWFYIAGSGALNQKPIQDVSFRRSLYSARIGYGKKDGSHIYLSGMYATDKAGSITLNDTIRTITPNSNYLFGIEGKLSLLKNKLSIDAEIAGSMLTRDNRDGDLENKAIPAFVKNIFHPKISSQIDYSYTVKTSFVNDESATKISAGLRMLGPGYITLGNPTLRGDKLEIESKIDQKLISRQISVSAFVKWYRDNLIKSKSSTTTTIVPGVTLNLRFKSYPYLVLSYMPNFMSNNQTNDTFKVDYKNHLFTAMTGHNIRISTMNVTSSLSYLFNKASSLDASAEYTSHSIALNEVFTLQIPLSLSASFGLTHSDYANNFSRIVSVDGSISHTLEDVWVNTLGGAASVEKGKNKKICVYYNAVFSFIKNISLDLRAEKNIYTDWISGVNNYDEFILQSTITANW